MRTWVWTLVTVVSWLVSVLAAFSLGAWWGANQPPLPFIGAP